MRKPVFASFLKSRVFVCFDHLGGVLSQLRNSSSSNEEYMSKFKITESCYGRGKKESVFNYDEDEGWHTCGSTSALNWIQIEMKNIYLSMRGYILMSYNFTCCHYPKSWYLEGRNSDKENWVLIDERTNEKDLDGPKRVKPFFNNKLSHCTFKIFRLTMAQNIVHGSSSYTYVVLNEMDFIGQIYKTQVGSSHNKQCRKLMLIILLLIV